ncbi:hypothetical protein EYC80_008506 [Monilinia laxa]|uniref:DUF3328 domain-containing protein n=1 Tax=Monilinia laxa TaxID=61186 RepID=A0A5N6JQH6_MONLA|nr:hypothetical protein EYC80_008506 [Monilinia laxa]
MNSYFLRWKKYHEAEQHDDDASETNEPFLDKENGYPTFQEKPRPFLTFILVTSIICNFFLLAFTLNQSWTSRKDVFQQMYTPAQSAIEYHNQNFENPIPKIDDEWAGPPTPERNERWRNLHYVGDTALSKLEASQLLNKTAAALPGSDEDYPIVLTVFHDLHCLDAIRLTLGYLRDPKWNSTVNPYSIPWPENFKGGLYSTDHAHHCFNSLRQSLQCFSDVTPQVFQYHPDRNLVISNFNVMHTCRNFDAIHQWALDNAYNGVFNFTGWRDEQGICGPDGCKR